MIKKPQSKLIISMLLATLLSPGAVLAESSKIPEPFVGHATITIGSERYFIGMGANQTVLNHDSSALLGFNKNTIENCITVISRDPFNLSALTASCFKFDPSGQTAIKLFNSKSYYDNTAEIETVAFFDDSTIIGDVSGVDSANFALYGKNLNKYNGLGSSSISGQTWTDASSYNSDAQASYSEEQKSYFDGHINDLKGEAIVLGRSKLNNTGTWYLQAPENNNFNSGPNNLIGYPNGKVWIINASNPAVTTLIRGSNTFRGNGTVIIDGDLTIKSGASVLKNSDSDSLGIIVLGNLTIEKNTKVEASILVADYGQESNPRAAQMIFNGDNINLSGSFMAKTFVRNSASTGIRISYDFRLESNWPPGFRFFNMPTPKDAAP